MDHRLAGHGGIRQKQKMLTADISSYDQRGRLLAAVAAAFVFSALQSWTVLAAGALGALLLAAMARYPLGLLLRRLAPANLFLIFLLLTVPWSMPGHAAFSIGPWISAAKASPSPAEPPSSATASSPCSWS